MDNTRGRFPIVEHFCESDKTAKNITRNLRNGIANKIAELLQVSERTILFSCDRIRQQDARNY